MTWSVVEVSQSRWYPTHPWISPTTVTGALTCTTLLSLINTSFVFSHISLSNASPRSCFLYSCSMQASRSKAPIHEMEAEGEEGARGYVMEMLKNGVASIFISRHSIPAKITDYPAHALVEKAKELDLFGSASRRSWFGISHPHATHLWGTLRQSANPHHGGIVRHASR